MTRTQFEFQVNDFFAGFGSAPAVEKLTLLVVCFGLGAMIALRAPMLAAWLYLLAFAFLMGWQYGSRDQ